MWTGILISYKVSEADLGLFQALGALSLEKLVFRSSLSLFSQDVWDWWRAVYLSNARWGGHLPEGPLGRPGHSGAAWAPAAEREELRGTSASPARAAVGRSWGFCAENMISILGADASLLCSAECHSDDTHPWKAPERHLGAREASARLPSARALYASLAVRVFNQGIPAAECCPLSEFSLGDWEVWEQGAGGFWGTLPGLQLAVFLLRLKWQKGEGSLWVPSCKSANTVHGGSALRTQPLPYTWLSDNITWGLRFEHTNLGLGTQYSVHCSLHVYTLKSIWLMYGQL